MLLRLLLLALFIWLIGEPQYYQKPSYAYPVDIVYTWVDGSDPVWRQKKDFWLRQYGKPLPSYADNPARYRDRNELKYSLRSVEKYLPWARRIYIVTDGQTPEWLNTDHPQIKIIDHKEILPADALPLFNSAAIETGLANIPELAEHFIYFNDDMFINKPLQKDFFFDEKGDPIIYAENLKTKDVLKLIEQNKERMWAKQWLTPSLLMQKTFGGELFFIIDNHAPTAYRKSYFLDGQKTFAKQFADTAHSKFREENDLSRMVLTLLDFYKKRTTVKINYQPVTGYGCKPAGMLIYENFDYFNVYDPCIFCLNDFETISEAALQQTQQVLRRRFPQPSHFEKAVK